MPEDRLALCLSGGGFRAALFHLGAMRRLNELGVLSHLDTISSVSGGSILAAHLATQLRTWPAPGASFPDWEGTVEAPFLRFTKTNIRTWPLLKRFLLPWNWFQPSTQTKALEATYRKKLTGLMLPDLPDQPTFIFCATELVYGAVFMFEKRRVGFYQGGYIQPAPNWPLARAVAASSSFPPIFSPWPAGFAGTSLSDGGLHDNLGLDPVQDHSILLVSDAGRPFCPAVPKGLFGRLSAYVSILGMPVGPLRKRLLIDQYQSGNKKGTYWGIGGAVDLYRPGMRCGYGREFARKIAMIRTDMDAFSDGEIAVLMNHGYLLADIALEVHVPQLISQAKEKQLPFPEWLDEGKALEALKESHVRRWLGRF